MLAGCAQTTPVDIGIRKSEAAVATSPIGGSRARVDITREPVAVVEGRAIHWDDLIPILAEMGGAAALEEKAVEMLLEQRCRAQGIEITEEDIDAERDLLLSSYIRQGLAPDMEEARAMLSRVREQRGLGRHRFSSLLYRNAMLRALVAGDVTLDDRAMEVARAIRFGPRYEARIIVVGTPASAERIRERIENGADFATLAAKHSTDPSAPRGGLLAPISPEDPRYPDAMRETLTQLEPGGTSGPVRVENGYALLRVENIIEASPPGGSEEEIRAELEAAERTRRERELMDRLGRRLLEDGDVRALSELLRE